MWGRAVFDNIRKFLQFQLTVNVVALTITFISAITGKEPPLNAVMMLWVNLIMDTMGALALGTEPPSSTLLDRRPYKRDASLISNIMMRNISIQFLFQMGILSYLLLNGSTQFGVNSGSKEHITIIFNTFVFCQIFNEINARSIGNDMNVFKGILNNPWFIAILLITSVGQFFIVEFGGEFVKTVPLEFSQWIKCILLGSLSLPVGGFMRLIPVSESRSDFAQISPLIKQNAKSQKSQKIKPEPSSNFSFFIWFVVVTVLPVITFHQFQGGDFENALSDIIVYISSFLQK